MTFTHFFPFPFFCQSEVSPLSHFASVAGHFAVLRAEKCTDNPWPVGTLILTPIFCQLFTITSWMYGKLFSLSFALIKAWENCKDRIVIKFWATHIYRIVAFHQNLLLCDHIGLRCKIIPTLTPSPLWPPCSLTGIAVVHHAASCGELYVFYCTVYSNMWSSGGEPCHWVWWALCLLPKASAKMTSVQRTVGCPKKTLFLNFVSSFEPLVLTSSPSPRKNFSVIDP